MSKPKWNGKILDVDLKGVLIPWHQFFGPILVLLDDCEDYFLPLFKTPENLHAHMKHLFERGLPHTKYGIKQIDDPAEFMESLVEGGVRMMYEPEIINENHTKWKEIVKRSDMWKFADPEMN